MLTSRKGLRLRITPPWGWFLQSALGEGKQDIQNWWEARRITYNFWLFIVGVATWFSVLIAGGLAVKPGVDFEEPFAMFLGPPIYALFANLCYTLGPIINRLVSKKKPLPGLLAFGFLFSILLTAAPGVWAMYCWYRAVKTGVLMK